MRRLDLRNPSSKLSVTRYMPPPRYLLSRDRCTRPMVEGPPRTGARSEEYYSAPGPYQPRMMMLRRLTRPAALLLLLLSACVSAPRPVQQAPTSAPELFPIQVIELSGSPQEMGTQYALQLSQP